MVANLLHVEVLRGGNKNASGYISRHMFTKFYVKLPDKIHSWTLSATACSSNDQSKKKTITRS